MSGTLPWGSRTSPSITTPAADPRVTSGGARSIKGHIAQRSLYYKSHRPGARSITSHIVAPLALLQVTSDPRSLYFGSHRVYSLYFKSHHTVASTLTVFPPPPQTSLPASQFAGDHCWMKDKALRLAPFSFYPLPRPSMSGTLPWGSRTSPSITTPAADPRVTSGGARSIKGHIAQRSLYYKSHRPGARSITSHIVAPLALLQVTSDPRSLYFGSHRVYSLYFKSHHTVASTLTVSLPPTTTSLPAASTA